MKGFILVIFLLTLPRVHAVPNLQVYPNSGPTDAKVDEITDIDQYSRYKSGTDKAQKQEEKTDPFELGPYDSEGNYQYIPKVREENAPQD